MPEIQTDTLRIAYHESGEAGGTPVVLLHGFPYDPRAYDAVAPALAGSGCRVIVPYLRGYGPTRFLSATTPRSGQQAALADDLIGLLDALGIGDAILGGYDWGGRAACIVAALWPERARGLVTCCGYNVQNIAAAARPVAPEQEYRWWYQYYFHTPRGRSGLDSNRRELCRLLWRLWSPSWDFDDATYARSAASFDNPDFVDVVVHSYRHRFGYAAGDPAFAETEQRLAAQPPIPVPTISLHGADDGVSPLRSSEPDARHFTGNYQRRVVPGAGHNLPQEKPLAVIEAVRDLMSRDSRVSA